VGGVSGGPTGFRWSYTIGSTGALVDYEIVNPGLSLSGDAPTLSLPGGTGGMTGVTIPTAYVETIPSGYTFYAPSSDGTELLAWGNNAGTLASSPFGGNQISIPLSPFVNARAGSFRLVNAYADRDTIPTDERFIGMLVKVVQAIDQGDGTYRALWFEMGPGDLSNSTWRTAPEFADNHVAFLSPPILDNGVLYFPGFSTVRYESNGNSAFYTPSSGAYVASPLSTSATVIRRHVFDVSIAAAGGTLEDAIVEVDDNAVLRDTQTKIVLAVTRNGRLLSNRDYNCIGDVPGGAVPNQFRYGLTPDNAPFIFPGGVAAAITDPDLIAMGFTRGIKGAANSGVTIGDYLSEPFEIGDYIVTRFWLYAETAGVFGTPQIYIYTSEQSVNLPIAPVMVRQINANVREYYYAGRLPYAGVGKWTVGSNNSANASLVWVVGAQFNRSSGPAYWIMHGDYPAPVDAAPLMADDLWMTSDRPLPLFPGNGMPDRTIEATAEVAASPDPTLPVAASPYFETARADGVIWLDPAQLAAQSLALTMRARDAAHSILLRVVPVHVRQVPLADPVEIKVAYFGDSHSASMFQRYLLNILAAWNITVTFYGTLEGEIGEQPGETRQYGEGRGGWGIANFFGTYQYVGGVGSSYVWTSVLGPGSVTAYTGGDFNTRQFTNPFLNNDSGSGSSAPVIADALPLLGGGTAAGFRFDLVNYRTRFALPTDIDFVLFEIGGNDQAQVGGAAALTLINTLYPIALAEIRRAWPTAQIIGWSGTTALVNDSEITWGERRPLYVSQLAAMRAAVAAGDTKMHYVSSWMHHTIRSGFPLAAGAVDVATQATRTTVSDEVHPNYMARHQSLVPLCAAIANLVEV
jgi:hypothetical protein